MAIGVEPDSRLDEPSDADLARRIGRGDRDAAGALIDRYQWLVRAFLLRITGRHDLADDLAQETFLRVLRYADRYDPQYAMRTWLLTIARRLWINELRRGRGRGRNAMTPADSLASDRPGPAKLVEYADELDATRRTLADAMATLTEPQQTALLLFHQQDLSLADAAEVMAIPIGTVKSHLHRGRAALRRILAPQPETSRQ